MSLDNSLDFFIFFTHQVLYHLALYPPETFINVKAYACRIFQSRHTEVCEYVVLTADAICDALMNTKVEALGLMLFDRIGSEVERFTIDVARAFLMQ